jgi:hypothetical protein
MIQDTKSAEVQLCSNRISGSLSPTIASASVRESVRRMRLISRGNEGQSSLK